jgi:hypothetical protein
MHKETIAIITLNSDLNYGNRLQNYALQNAIQKAGYPVNTIIIDGLLVRIIKIVKKLPFIHGSYRIDKAIVSKKTKKISPFSKKYIITHKLTNTNNIGSFSKFIVGSDQVWNPMSSYRGELLHFLTFVPLEKRFSYAASFGASEIPKNKKTKYSRYLKNFNQISVRETQGAKIVKELTGRTVPVVLDPTLLLARKDWDNLIEQDGIAVPDEKYILLYFIHDPAQEVIKKIQLFAKNNNYKVYHVMGDQYNKTYQIPTVPEFVSRIKHAKMIFTDSFHAAVFSTIFHTPFAVFDRTDAKMSSRITNLLKITGMQDSFVDGSLKFDDIIKKSDFHLADARIARERKKSMNYLNGVLSSKKSQK